MDKELKQLIPMCLVCLYFTSNEVDFRTFRIQALTNPEYRDSLKDELTKDQFSFKFCKLNSWYYPLISQQVLSYFRVSLIHCKDSQAANARR